MVKNLKKLRTEKGISQQKLADILGTSQQAINKYENQNCEPDIDMLISMADYFGTTVDYLIGKDDSKYSSDYLSSREWELLNWYRNIDDSRQEAFSAFIDFSSADPNNF